MPYCQTYVLVSGRPTSKLTHWTTLSTTCAATTSASQQSRRPSGRQGAEREQHPAFPSFDGIAQTTPKEAACPSSSGTTSPSAQSLHQRRQQRRFFPSPSRPAAAPSTSTTSTPLRLWPILYASFCELTSFVSSPAARPCQQSKQAANAGSFQSRTTTCWPSCSASTSMPPH